MVLAHTPATVVRLRVTPDEPDDGPRAVETDRPRMSGQASRRPHNDLAVANVRYLIEQTTLTYSQIARKTGVGRASICRWTRDGPWQRPAFAPRATDTVPRARAGQKLKLRKLAERLRMLAERMVRALEETPDTDLDRLVQALQVVKMARLEAQGRRRRRRWPDQRGETGAQWSSRQEAIRNALREMKRGGVDLDRAPQEALDLVIDANTPAEQDHPDLSEGMEGEEVAG